MRISQRLFVGFAVVVSVFALAFIGGRVEGQTFKKQATHIPSAVIYGTCEKVVTPFVQRGDGPVKTTVDCRNWGAGPGHREDLFNCTECGLGMEGAQPCCVGQCTVICYDGSSPKENQCNKL